MANTDEPKRIHDDSSIEFGSDGSEFKTNAAKIAGP
jgi:hypothetical protein